MRVAILGAGGSGLASIKCCLDEKLEPECFEQNSDVGGNWLYSEEPGHSSIYKSTIINTSKDMNTYSDFPMPKHFPPFMTHDYMLHYYRLYAERYNLMSYIKFGCKVVDVRRDETGRQWKVTYENTVCTDSKLFDAIMVCTGHLSKPRWPEFPGMEKFQGQMLHSHTYKTFKGFENKTVIVVGLGNSAGDIACELSRHARKVYISTRKGTWVRSRLIGGLPFDYYYTRFHNDLPSWIRYRLFGWQHIKKTDYEAFGLLTQGNYWSGASIINEDILSRITTGTISIQSNIDFLTECDVVFTDGTRVKAVDAVIFCTGYKVDLDFLDKTIFASRENNELDLYKYVFPPDNHTLAFIGYVTINGSMNPTFEIQARWATRVFLGIISLPSRDEMWRDIREKREHIMDSVDYTPRHAFIEGGIKYADEIASIIGCRPNLWRLLFNDPLLAVKCYFGPHHPSQYRLHGPGTWPGAKARILNIYTNFVYPMKTRTLPSENNSGYHGYSCKAKFLAVFGVCGTVYLVYKISSRENFIGSSF